MIRLAMIGIPGEYGNCLISSLKSKGIKNTEKYKQEKIKNFPRRVIMLLHSWKPNVVHIHFLRDLIGI